jgi:hypothetical protein
MSAFGGKTDITRGQPNVCLRPKADIANQRSINADQRLVAENTIAWRGIRP